VAKLTFQFPAFRHAPKVVFGRGSVRSLATPEPPTETLYFVSAAGPVQEYVKNAFLQQGGNLAGSNLIVKPPGEPTEASIRWGSQRLTGRPVTRVVAIGGGSVMDWARLVLAESLGKFDTAANRLNPATVARPELWLVPTTCGTGAEAADVVVFSDETGRKKSVFDAFFAADRVVLDARFLDDVAPSRLAGFVCDALSHGIESYLSVVPNNLAKHSAVSALRTIFGSFAAEIGPSDKERLMEASFLAGVAAANCSVGIVHSFAHSVGEDGVPHGLANAVALDSGIAFNSEVPAMSGLLDALGLANVGELRAGVHRVTEVARVHAAEYAGLRKLANDDFRDTIAERMSKDVTIRTNPRRATSDDLSAFVRGVATQLHS
jgi:alcohol dehydrogenase class IV